MISIQRKTIALSPQKQGRIHGTRCILSAFENNTGRTYGPTDGRTDTTSYKDATVHLKIGKIKDLKKTREFF